ncbi:alpha-glucoside transport system permease protein [Ardenticatena maritima]|uniref:Alpha-glucoside transport system permease protein n=2 Tax=Ardenticatena maritima TaxID=872965 RepID=A0A0M8K7U1_9CHLR|nr:alpha-glucoside transport system permease protein [Ardenticatena maritima]
MGRPCAQGRPTCNIVGEFMSTQGEIRKTPLDWLVATFGRLAVSIVIPIVVFGVMILGFQWLRAQTPSSNTQKALLSLVAIVWGVGGTALLYVVMNFVVESLPPNLMRLLQPYVFVGPAMAILGWYLAVPTIRTFWLSLHDRTGEKFVGLSNYVAVFTERAMFEAFRNNLLWILFGATFTVVFGLIIAVLADRSRFENIAKSLIFMPMAISMVGAGVIWNFIYEVRDINSPQIGLLNAIVVALGGEPQAWTALIQPWNNLFLIVVMIWMQTGFAMVIFSAAIKGIPDELLEAARVDGANELQVFFRIMLPYISGTIITVLTTVVIFALKIFDIVQVMTGGQFGTHVIATQFYRQAFTNQNKGYASAIAIVLLITVIPVMIYNLRHFSEEEAF